MTQDDQAPAATEAARTGAWLAFGLMVLLGTRIAALWLARTDLFFDEAQYWSWSRALDFGYFSKPPMIALVIRMVTGACGHSEFCVRLASPLLHTGAALFIYGAGGSLYGPRVGAWSALVYASLPGISFSSGLISTDVPLLFFWAAALWAWVKLLQTRKLPWAIALGLALGLGLMSKYAMAYFYLSIGLFLILERDGSWLLKSVHGAALVVLPMAILAPNILWNLDHGLVTFSHTMANAKWEGSLVHPLKAVEFFAAQFGVFGPVLMAVLIWIVARAGARLVERRAAMLLIFSLPVIGLIGAQAFASRAHANWAAVAYPAAAILVTATLLEANWRRLFRASLLLHGGLVAAIAIGWVLAPRIALPGRAAPYMRLLGWKALAAQVRQVWQEGSYAVLLSEDRRLTAELIYYLRDSNIPIAAWKPSAAPRDHYELTRDYGADKAEPVLLVTIRPSVAYVTSRFAQVVSLGARAVPAGPGHERALQFYALDGLKSRQP